LIVIFYFFLLGTLADRFFLPSLMAFADALHLPPTVSVCTEMEEEDGSLTGWEARA
jgi:hypothetical protein